MHRDSQKNLSEKPNVKFFMVALLRKVFRSQYFIKYMIEFIYIYLRSEFASLDM